MPFSNDYTVYHLLVPTVAMVFLVWSLVGAAVGAGLMVCSAHTFRLFRMVNHYVSTRHALRALSAPHDVSRSVYRHRRLIGACFVLGSAGSAYGLIAWFNSAAIVAALHLGYPDAFVAWIAESLRWYLLLFGAFAFAIGIMLGFFPGALKRFETRANRWYSPQVLGPGADTMHLPLDRLVEAYPRSAGAIVVVAALYVAFYAAVLWLRFR